MQDKILTLHPEGKNGVNIDRSKYDAIKDAIVKILTEHPGTTFSELTESIDRQMPDFQGSIPWYVTSVKLDLEARGIIERIPKSSPQRLQLAG